MSKGETGRQRNRTELEREAKERTQSLLGRDRSSRCLTKDAEIPLG